MASFLQKGRVPLPIRVLKIWGATKRCLSSILHVYDVPNSFYFIRACDFLADEFEKVVVFGSLHTIPCLVYVRGNHFSQNILGSYTAMLLFQLSSWSRQ